MDQPPPSQPAPSSTTENPIVAVGRKVKSMLNTSDHPSIRIVRGTPGTEKPLPPLPPHEKEQEPEKKTFGNRFRSFFSDEDENAINNSHSRDEYDASTVDLMDVMDPEVATLSTLTNVQNSLFVPQLGKIVNRRPAYRISENAEDANIIDKLKASLKRFVTGGDKEDGAILQDAQYAILPDGETLQGWSREDKEELDDLVRHKLHSRRARWKRSLKGFGQYVRRPLGLFITVYATLITLFGAAWVLFLIGWISVGSKKDYIVNVVDNVLVALFAIIGDGLAPFRAVDTYHMIYIAHYHRLTWKKRETLGLPELVDHNDLPEQQKQETPAEIDLESRIARRMPAGLARRIAPRIPERFARRFSPKKTEDPAYEYTVLTEEQMAKLEFHERKFSKSHTFYKPHETETHYAFPLKLLVAIVVLLDMHSCLQISLGACTWGIPYEHRPFALTTVILCCSITCNIMGGVLISVGDKRTRKKDVIERMMRQELTSEAIDEIETRKLKEAEERGEIDPNIRKRREEEKEEAENEEIKKSWKYVPNLPKHLLGKGEDKRQPSLPQEARRGSTPTGSTTNLKAKEKGGSSQELPVVREDTTQGIKRKPVPGANQEPKGNVPPKEGTGQKVMKMIRRADLDRS